MKTTTPKVRGFFTPTDHQTVHVSRQDGCCWGLIDPVSGVFRGIPNEDFEGAFVAHRENPAKDMYALVVAVGNEEYHFVYRLHHKYGLVAWHHQLSSLEPGAIIRLTAVPGKGIKAIVMSFAVDGAHLQPDPK